MPNLKNRAIVMIQVIYAGKGLSTRGVAKLTINDANGESCQLLSLAIYWEGFIPNSSLKHFAK
jgi:hypothetical protein